MIYFLIFTKYKNAYSYINYVDIKDENNFIICSYDKSIKLWNKNNNKFKINKIYFKLWNYNEINNINLIKEFKETYCGGNQALCRLNYNIIIVRGKGTTSLKLISISKKEIIKTINNPFQCWGISLIEDKGIFLVGGVSNDIRIYRNDNYEYIKEIKDAHNDNITLFIELKNGSIASFSYDQKIKVLSF